MSLRRVFIIREAGFWGKQGAGCLFYAQDTGRVLVAHRSDQVTEPGTWGTWGGKIEDGEDPAAAAEREAHEESGEVGELLPIWTFQHPSGFKYYNFLAVVPSEFQPKLNWETQGSKWVEYGRWPQPMHPGLTELARRPELATALKRIAA